MLTALRFIATHPLSARRPLPALARYAWWQINSRLRDEIEFDWIDGAKLVARNGMTGATGNIYCGLHEFEDMAFALHLLREGDRFLDIGANIGSYTVLASRVAGAATIAIEPDPETCQALRRNVETNRVGDRVRIVEAAVGDHEGTIPFTVGHDTTNRVSTDLTAPNRTVALRLIDDIVGVEEPLCMKIDVEGYERFALAGARETLAKASLRAILIETVDPQIRAMLEGLGFQEYAYAAFERKLRTPDGAGSAGRANTLFVRDPDFCAARLSSAPTRIAAGVAV